jgi:hypothetical protein
VGSYPAEIGLYQTGAVAEALRQLLGSKFAVFSKTCRSAAQKPGPAALCQRQQAARRRQRNGLLLLDPASRQLEVGLVEQGKLTVYRSGPALYRPAEITTMLSNIDGQP